MNRRSTIIVIAIISLFPSCRPDDNGQAKKEELKNIIIDYYNALAKKDLKKANSLTTSNFILFEDGRIYNNQVAIDSVAKMGQFSFSTTIDSLNVHVDKKNASAYYFRKADFTFPPDVMFSVHFLESCTFNKEDDKWKLRFLQTSVRK